MKHAKIFKLSLAFFGAFILWTLLIRCIDVSAIGPQGSTVGFAKINRYIHTLTGVHMSLYHITDWLGLVPIAFMIGFAALGLIQWIKRKQLASVDLSILLLGGLYLVVLAVYLFFEQIIINYRPILINGYLEPSYPSSTTMLVLCVMPSAILQNNRRVKSTILKRSISTVIILFVTFMVLGRLFSGVHWFTDIIGGALLSAGLVTMYYASLYFEQN